MGAFFNGVKLGKPLFNGAKYNAFFNGQKIWPTAQKNTVAMPMYADGTPCAPLFKYSPGWNGGAGPFEPITVTMLFADGTSPVISDVKISTLSVAGISGLSWDGNTFTFQFSGVGKLPSTNAGMALTITVSYEGGATIVPFFLCVANNWAAAIGEPVIPELHIGTESAIQWTSPASSGAGYAVLRPNALINRWRPIVPAMGSWGCNVVPNKAGTKPCVIDFYGGQNITLASENTPVNTLLGTWEGVITVLP